MLQVYVQTPILSNLERDRMSSIFTKIINGEIPCYKIYEDEHTFAFLDIKPMHPGHTIVVPKTEVDHFYDLNEPYRSAVAATCQKIAKAISKAT
jgi:histidine triad (HIT) family protein